MTKQEKFMRMAIKEAKKGQALDEVPVGAVLVINDAVVAKAYNKRESKRDAVAHAEIICIQKACKKLKDFRLTDAELYVTLEPCLMCFGAILNARIKKVYFGASMNKAGSLSCEEIVARAELNHKCELEKGIFEDECSKMISDYFKSKRKNNKQV